MMYVMLISGDSFFFSFVSFVQELHRLDMIIFLHIQVWYRASFIHLIVIEVPHNGLGFTELEIQGLRLRRGTSCATLGPGGSLAGCLGEAPAWWISGTHSTRHWSYRSWDAGMDAAGGAAQCRRITEKKGDGLEGERSELGSFLLSDFLLILWCLNGRGWIFRKKNSGAFRARQGVQPVDFWNPLSKEDIFDLRFQDFPQVLFMQHIPKAAKDASPFS